MTVLVAVVCVASFVLFRAGGADAAPGPLALTVTNGVDETGPGTLRSAIDQVNSSGAASAVIQLSPGPYVIDRCNTEPWFYRSDSNDDNANILGDLDVTADVSLRIVGLGAGATIRGECADTRLLDVHGRGLLHLENLGLTGGRGVGDGGAVRATGDVELVRVNAEDNRAVGEVLTDLSTPSVQIHGGAVWSAGSVTVSGSRLVNNSVGEARPTDPNLFPWTTASDGSGGAIASAMAVTIRGSVLSDNAAHGSCCTIVDHLPVLVAGAGHGGALAAASVNVDSSTFDRNVADGRYGTVTGGAIDAQNVAITTSSFSDNAATSSPGHAYDPGPVRWGPCGVTSPPVLGGAIHSSGRIEVTSSSLADNSAVGGLGTWKNYECPGFPGSAQGGALSSNGDIVIRSSSLSANRAEGGPGRGQMVGGIFDLANGAAASGGAAHAGGRVEVSRSIVHGNAAAGGPGDGFGGPAQGGGISAVGPATVTQSLFSANVATGGEGGQTVWPWNTPWAWGSGDANGGALATPGPVTTDASSFIGNTAWTPLAIDGGYQPVSAGGAIASTPLGRGAPSGSIDALNSTFANDEADMGAALDAAGITLRHVTIAPRRGASALSGGTLLATASVVLGVEAWPGTGTGTACAMAGAVTSGDDNVTGDTSCGLGDPRDVVITSGAALLDPVANNGGPAPTMSPVANGPLVDAIAPLACSVAVDERGAPRPVGAGCDVGAVELGESAPDGALVAAITPTAPVVPALDRSTPSPPTTVPPTSTADPPEPTDTPRTTNLDVDPASTVVIPPDTVASSRGELPATGTDARSLIAVGVALIMSGVSLSMLTRMKRPHH